MMVSADKLGYLLDGTKRIIAHQKEVAELRGETFNVFSILKMERLENSTHSAFITELLNPHGSHLKGNIFLKLFLDTLDEIPLTLDLASANAKPEHHIGTRDVDSKTGGRIDIYISDDFNNCISIENKIDAIDQEAQIERYCNHNKGKNTVLYLTLHGSEPSIASKGALKFGIDFYTVSYRKHIVEWLDKCLKEAAEQPILRESIKQYKLLLQKLTATMEHKEQQELTALMLKYYTESEYIAKNFESVKIAIKEGIRQSVIGSLKVRLEGSYSIESGHSADKVHSNIWIKPKGLENSKVYFGIQGFSGLSHFDGALMVGLINKDGEKTIASHFQDRYSDWWLKTSILSGPDQSEVKLNDPEILQRLNADTDYREYLVNHIASEVEANLDQHVEQLRVFLTTENLVTAN